VRLLVVLMLWGAQQSSVEAQIPESLDDSTFWSLLTELSESGGEFADENFVSNELGLQRLLPELEREFAPAEVYIGVGPEQNFSYVAALEPSIAFVLDIRRQNAMEHLLYKALFELSDTRAEFVTRLFSPSSSMARPFHTCSRLLTTGIPTTCS
jgi:hypothetical protein